MSCPRRRTPGCTAERTRRSRHSAVPASGRRADRPRRAGCLAPGRRYERGVTRGWMVTWPDRGWRVVVGRRLAAGCGAAQRSKMSTLRGGACPDARAVDADRPCRGGFGPGFAGRGVRADKRGRIRPAAAEVGGRRYGRGPRRGPATRPWRPWPARCGRRAVVPVAAGDRAGDRPVAVGRGGLWSRRRLGTGPATRRWLSALAAGAGGLWYGWRPARGPTDPARGSTDARMNKVPVARLANDPPEPSNRRCNRAPVEARSVPVGTPWRQAMRIRSPPPKRWDRRLPWS